LSAAITALETCQPFAELPPDKYSKWKTLELVVSPAVLLLVMAGTAAMSRAGARLSSAGDLLHPRLQHLPFLWS
jgi:hypothetical protein